MIQIHTLIEIEIEGGEKIAKKGNSPRNGPSKTGRPSGKGRGNNFRGSKSGKGSKNNSCKYLLIY